MPLPLSVSVSVSMSLVLPHPPTAFVCSCVCVEVCRNGVCHDVFPANWLALPCAHVETLIATGQKVLIAVSASTRGLYHSSPTCFTHPLLLLVVTSDQPKASLDRAANQTSARRVFLDQSPLRTFAEFFRRVLWFPGTSVAYQQFRIVPIHVYFVTPRIIASYVQQ